MLRLSSEQDLKVHLSDETTPFLDADRLEAGTTTALHPSPGNVEKTQKSIVSVDSVTAAPISVTHTTESVPEGSISTMTVKEGEETSPLSPSLQAEDTQPMSHNCPGIDCNTCEAAQRRANELEELQRLEVYDAPFRETSSKFEPSAVQLLIRPDEHDVAQEAQRHTRTCQRHNRFKRPRRHRYRSDSRHRHDDDRKFLDLIEQYKDQKLETECVCELTKWTRFQEYWYEVRRVLHIVWRLLWTLCPPLPNFCLNKIMFWPPRREYFFFKSDEIGMKNGAEAAQKAKLKIRKGKAEFAKGQIFRFGFEHQCAPEIEKVECFFIQTKRNNQIACVFVSSPFSSARYTIIFAHPNASDISDHLSGCPNLHEAARFLNCDILSFDYSGYGISSGRPSEANVYADSDAAFDYLVKTRKVPIENIILWGYSIGTAAMIDLALKIPKVAGVILLAAPTSIVRTLCWNRGCCCRRKNPCLEPNDCYCDRFKSIRKIGLVSPPTLFIHGIGDVMVPVEHSQALYRRAGNAVKPLFVPELGHNNLENSRLVWNRMRFFLNREARKPKPNPERKQPKKDLKKDKKLKTPKSPRDDPQPGGSVDPFAARPEPPQSSGALHSTELNPFRER